MSIQTHPRKRLEMIVDEPHLPRFIRLFEQMKVRGYTILESKSGKGSRGAWAPARLSNVDDRVMVVAVTDGETVEQLLVELQDLFEELPGVAFVSDVQVIRPDRF
jgi:PII-like signaling protein